MKKLFDWQVIFGICLVVLSAVVYFTHFFLFRDVHHIFIYLIGDIGFVFIEVLMVVLILERVLHYREKTTMLKKLNMVIGAFFSETGRELMDILATFDPECSNMKVCLIISTEWQKRDFLKAKAFLKQHTCSINLDKGDISALRDFLLEKRYFLLNLLENPNLLEHESFTNLLWAVFHLTEELAFRKDLTTLQENDKEHIGNDIKRAYRLLVIEWLAYMKHLKQDYPYLFSLAIRTNPFDESAEVEVRQ